MAGGNRQKLSKPTMALHAEGKTKHFAKNEKLIYLQSRMTANPLIIKKSEPST
jgi:hypothetical protein